MQLKLIILGIWCSVICACAQSLHYPVIADDYYSLWLNNTQRLAISTANGNIGVGTAAPLDKVHIVGGIVQTNGGISQAFSIAAPSAPATQGAVYWNDGTNICVVLRNAAGTLTTNKVAMAAWP